MFRLIHILLLQFLHVFRQCCREQHRHTLFRHLIDDGFHLFDEAHIQHFVRFIEHQILDAVEFQCTAFDVVEHTSWSSYNHVAFLFQFGLLVGKWLLAVDRCCFNAFEAPDIGDVFFDLIRQFAGRCQNQRLRFVFFPFDHFTDRYAECSGFPTPRL